MNRTSQGFTLIELLLSISILMLVLLTAMFGYQLYNSQWSRNLSLFEEAYQNYRNYDLLSKSLQGIIPYSVNATATADQDGVGFYFLGREEGFTAVTLSPIFNPGNLAVIRVFREMNADGGYNLVYEEAPLNKDYLITPEQNLPFQHRLLLAKHLDSIEFRYFAVPNLASEIEFDAQGQAVERRQWLSAHDGLTARTHPEQLELLIAGYPLYAHVARRSEVLMGRATLEVL